MLVNRSVVSNHVLRSTRRQGLLLSFCFKEGCGCENVLSKIALLVKIFKVLAEESALRSPVSFFVMKGAIFLCSGTSRIVWFCFQMLYLGLIFDDFEDVLNQELQLSEVVRPTGRLGVSSDKSVRMVSS